MRISDWSSDVCSSDLRIAGAVGRLPGVVLANPMIEGQVMGTANNTAAGVQVRGVRGADLMHEKALANGLRAGTLKGFDDSEGVAVGYRLARSEEHTSELQSLMRISYAGFCLKK